MKAEELKIYNTLSGKKETFISSQPGRVGMYVCGPTTYNYIHLGNARPLVVFDTVRRYLEHLGYQVTYIQNFTDVDDKIIKRAQEENMPPLELAAKYIKEYYEDADALNVKRASVHPKVSEHMGEIVSFIEDLINKGHAYEIDGDVYFSVESFTSYGKLSKRSIDDLQAGARVEVNERKRHPGDFALWKKAKVGEPAWESPWGQGRPGWHIECSAMSCKYLGWDFDIHAGGFDLIFPHHENEIAQSEAHCEAPMARYWMHNGFITVNEEKMSKSLGNFFLLRDILKKFPPEVIRFYLLSTHYRSPLDFDDEKLEAAKKGLDRLQTAYRLLLEAEAKASANGNLPVSNMQTVEQEAQGLYKRFMDAMNDDFNTALAIAILFDFARMINTTVAGGVKAGKDAQILSDCGRMYQELSGILGIKIEREQEVTGDLTLVDGLMELIIKIRQDARQRKDYQTADTIRDGLRGVGIILEDTPQGMRWRYQ